MSSVSDQQYQTIWDMAKKVFLPFTPIELVELFHGRQNEIHSITDALTMPGRHAVMFGERGVGKTSLANLIPFFTSWPDASTFRFSCSQNDTFETIFDGVLSMLGKESFISKKSSTREAGLNVAPIKLNNKTTNEEHPTERFCIDTNSIFSLIKDNNVLIILDEFDRIKDPVVCDSIAELIKKLSDYGSKSKLLIVGVATTIDELIGAHPSAVRCLKQVPIRRMSNEEVQEIFAGGFDALSITLPNSLRLKLASISDGFPHYAHLLGLNLVFSTLERLVSDPGGHPLAVITDDYLPAIRKSVDESIRSLEESYRRGTETLSGKKTDLYKWILEAIAVQAEVEVENGTILQYVSKISGYPMKSQAISPHLGKLVNLEKRGVLDRPRTGIYKFRDPMLRAFIRMKIAQSKLEKNVSYRQLEFNFV